jgi:hypothetical protein
MQASDKQIQSLLTHLFQSPEETIKVLAPDGWENSPYLYYLHPTHDQIFAYRMDLYETHKDGKLLKFDMPVLEEIVKEYEATPVKPVYEFLDLFGNCLWKIFSDGHTVFDKNGIEYDLGSFRGTGSTLADFMNDSLWTETKFDYLDFYCAMGLKSWLPVQSVYELIFERLKQLGCDWRYSHSRVNLFSFNKEQEEIKPEEYEPAKNALAEIENAKREDEIAKFQSQLAQLDEAAEQDKEQSLNNPPKTVLAYRKIYGKLPEGFLE